MIAIAGPLVNVAIALALIAIASADMRPQHLAAVERASVSMVDRLATVNLFLAAFNLIPAFQMDGGRVLRALLATPARFQKYAPGRVAAAIGQGFAFLLGFIGLFGNPLLIFIAIFVYLAASAEAQMVAVRAVYARRTGLGRHDDAIRDAGARGAAVGGDRYATTHQPG